MKRNPFARRGAGGGSRHDEPREQEYWLSYSDLMAGLLMVFALMLLAASYRHDQSASDLEDVTDRVSGAVQTMAVRDSIIEEFRRKDIGGSAAVHIDTVTASIRLSDGVLFEENSARLQPEGRRVLSEFISTYLPVVIDNPRYRDHLREIGVEGHTNDNGTYLYNVRLSQDRAHAVLDFFLRNAPDGETLAFLERYLTARGRSFSRVICDGLVRPYQDCPAHLVDKAASRRIEIHFRLDDEEVVREVKTLLDERPGTDARPAAGAS